jgi:hypothetical protein
MFMRPRSFYSTSTGAARRSLALAALLLLACDGASAAPKEGDMAKVEAGATLGSAAGVRIDRPVVAVLLPIARTGPAAERLHRALAAPGGRGAGAVELVLDKMTAEAALGVMFRIYLSTTEANPRRQYVRTLSFFGLDQPANQRSLPARSFDVTSQIRALGSAGGELPEVQVVFEATDGTAGSTPAKAGSQLNPKADFTVGSLRLQVKG